MGESTRLAQPQMQSSKQASPCQVRPGDQHTCSGAQAGDAEGLLVSGSSAPPKGWCGNGFTPSLCRTGVVETSEWASVPWMGIRDLGLVCLALSPEETSSDTLPTLIKVQLRLKVTGLGERGLKSLIP